VKDRKIVVNFLFVVFFLALSACARKEVVKQPQPLPPVPEKITTYTLIERITTPEIKTLQGRITISISQNGESIGKFSGVLLYQYPDRLRIKVFGPLWFTLAEFLFDHGFLQVLIPLKDSLYSDTVPFKSFFPDRARLETSIKFIEETDEQYVLYVVEFTNTEKTDLGNSPDLILKAKYSFQKSDLTLSTVDLYKKSKKQFGIKFYRTEEKTPSEIGIQFGGTSLLITLDDVEMNEPLKDDFFKPLEASQTFPLSGFLSDFIPAR
jgi:hypothetical protein